MQRPGGPGSTPGLTTLTRVTLGKAVGLSVPQFPLYITGVGGINI